MLIAHEREQAGQFDIAEGMHFGEYMVVSHLVVVDVFLPLSITSRLKERPLGQSTSWGFVQDDKLVQRRNAVRSRQGKDYAHVPPAGNRRPLQSMIMRHI